VFFFREYLDLFRNQIINYPNQYITADIRTVEQESCTDFGPDVITKLKADERTRDVFFAEISEFLSSEFSMEILDIKISDESKICIRYIQPIQINRPRIHQKNSTTRLV